VVQVRTSFNISPMRPVGAGDEFEQLGFGFFRVRADLGAQVLLGVVERVLDERGALTFERVAQLPQVLIDRAGRGGRHTSVPSMKRSTKPRVCHQIARQRSSIARPLSVTR